MEVHQSTDPDARWFFTRMEIETHTLRADLPTLREAFQPLANEVEADWTLRSAESRLRVVLMVSRLGHCLADLLWRWRSGELAFDIPMVISNHEDYRSTVEREGISFYCLPFSDDRAVTFRAIAALWDEARADLVVLARYMQIIPGDLCEKWAGRIMNIHHSFLPSFVGGNPYQRAHERA